jgi:hypothetical protein
MLLRVFTFLFEFVMGRQEPVFRDQIYEPVGAVLIISTILLTLFFYYLVNGLRARFGKTSHWGTVMACDAVFNVIAVLWISFRSVTTQPAAIPVVFLSLLDGFYAAMAFIIASLVFKWGSPNARRTPF